MRLIRGISLKEEVSRFHSKDYGPRGVGERTLRLRELLGRFIAVCNAVAYAHSRGVLHRDLKPANIMLGSFGETLLVDWGLAKLTGAAPEGADQGPVRPSAAAETAAGSSVGTPSYMSPEQAEGRLDRLAPATDVYCLGATLYHVLTGVPPVQGDDTGEVLRKVARGEFPRPRSIDRRIPRGLEAACLKAMRLRPADRYQSTTALALTSNVGSPTSPCPATKIPCRGGSADSPDITGRRHPSCSPLWRPHRRRRHLVEVRPRPP